MPLIDEKFTRFCQNVNKAKKVIPFEGTLLALDPGETTGWSIFIADKGGVKLTAQGQIKSWPMANAVKELERLLFIFDPGQVVYETYAVYEWKSQDHSWSKVPTLHIIGCIETLCIQRNIPYCDQTAQVAKNFCTDNKLESWGYYVKGQRHARDSIRHGTYYLMFRK